MLMTPSKQKPRGDVLKPLRTAVIAALLYVISAGAYIIISSTYLGKSAQSIEEFEVSELSKGLLFVWVTGIILALILWEFLNKMNRQAKKITFLGNALIKSERAAVAGMLASSIAHDINNVLSGISMAVYLIQKEFGELEVSRNYFEYIQKGEQQLKGLSERLLNVNKGSLNEKPTKFMLDEILDASIEFSKLHDDVRFCAIWVDCRKDLELVGYPHFLEQMFFNLILNAAQATNGKGKIFFRVVPNGEFVDIEIADNGPGIPLENHEKIFQPFFTTKKNGTGLGMLSIKACLDVHNGEISIHESEMGGAQIDLVIPRFVSPEMASS